ncbi:hypothetical protein Lalb_Chr18g0057141 [Lupinus albus]|uniref:DUF7722 domain-containing protein n=1 Tax=Lupinus albus TaxID=3870 RepID=A0A6A4NM94_LUPAL|nr:hypothetical protein Lalb_Chr18g0057141 [Lupinus albus]
MALAWLLRSACHVLGHPIYKDNTEKECNQIGSYSNGEGKKVEYPSSGFQMPLHYPRYTKAEYERMEDWKVDLLLKQYGLSFKGTLHEKRLLHWEHSCGLISIKCFLNNAFVLNVNLIMS